MSFSFVVSLQFSCWLEFAWRRWRCETWQPKYSRWRNVPIRNRPSWLRKPLAPCFKLQRNGSWKKWAPKINGPNVKRPSAQLQHRHFVVVYGLGPDSDRRRTVSCFTAESFWGRANSFPHPKANRVSSFPRVPPANVGDDPGSVDCCWSAPWRRTRCPFLVPNSTLLANHSL